MKLAIRITTAGAVEELDMSADGLQVLQTAVGGWVQAIDLDDELTMWLNEEGKLVGLPHNPYAQFAWDKRFGAHTDYMVGDVVFTGGTDEDGATLGLDQDTADQIRMLVRQVAQIIEPRIEIIS
jgi:hypothetical protein